MKKRELAGCLPFIVKGESWKILLVTSRTHPGRLIFPKGAIKSHESPRHAALRETWEEAGVTGTLLDRLSENWYVLRVEEVAEEWPERGERERWWGGREIMELGNVTKEVKDLIGLLVEYLDKEDWRDKQD